MSPPPALALPLLALALGLAACQRLNPDWCNKPGRCPAGTSCEPATNTCLAVADARRDLARPPDGAVRLDQPSPSDAAGLDAEQGCVAGWICLAGAAAQCRELGPGSKLRNCPVGGCLAGHCLVPQGARSCTSNQACPQAPQIWFCTWLLEAGTTPRQLCAPAVPGLEGAASCSSGLQCATGLCTEQGRCYYACDDASDCPAPASCQDSSVSVEGLLLSVRSCAP